MDFKDRAPAAPAADDRRFPGGVRYDLITWLVAAAFLPLIVWERWRRHRERRTPAGRARERAISDALKTLPPEFRHERNP